MKLPLSILGLCLAAQAGAQTLFTYGTDAVSVPAFKAAYEKNKTAAGSTLSVDEYLQLYIASRLKIKEAVMLRYDTLPQLRADIEGLRQQIMPPYLNDESAIDKLVDEAVQRSQKDIQLQHIFLKGGNDAAVQARLAHIQSALKTKPFAEAARQFSDDPSAAQNGGAIGWVTVFSLPYALENLAYNTAVGTVSQPYLSSAGYHLFKNVAERKAVGTTSAAHIRLAFPPDATAAQKATLKKRIDSIYNRLLKGDDFAKLAARFSDDQVSAQAGGLMPSFGVGQYDAVFENAVAALQKSGAMSKPFVTGQGWHIVKLVKRLPVAAQPDEAASAILREKVIASDRSAAVTAALAERIRKEAGFKKEAYDEAALFRASDAVLNNTPADSSFGANRFLFRIGDKRYHFSHWIAFAQVHRYKNDGSGIKPNPGLWNEFVQQSTLDYYKENLERFNPQFKAQLDEFKEGSLFFEIMQQKVWTPAATDTIALQTYYAQNKDKYRWTDGSEAVVFYVNDSTVLKPLMADLRKSPQSWRTIINGYNEKAAADSGRYEWDQLPTGARNTKANAFSGVIKNADDGTATFAYIIKPRPGGDLRSFSEARAQVITSYQTALEEKWMEELKKKYPVKVNDAELAKMR